jgi:hypothetical protein
MKFTASLISIVVYIVLLLGIYVVHALYFTVDVVFYAAILDAVIAGILTLALVSLIPFFSRLLSLHERALLFVIWLLGGYAFAISGPAVLDRSLSIYFVEKLVQRGGGIQLERIDEVFINEYVVEHRLLDIRLTEQVESGTIEIVDGCVRVTERGRELTAITRFLRTNFLAKTRLIMGEYTDDLTDPFRNSVEATDYGCQANAADPGTPPPE